MKDKNKRATVGPLPGVTQDIAGYKVMLLSQCFFTIADSFIFMFLFILYYFARQQKTWISSMLTILPPNWCYLCGTLLLWVYEHLSFCHLMLTVNVIKGKVEAHTPMEYDSLKWCALSSKNGMGPTVRIPSCRAGWGRRLWRVRQGGAVALGRRGGRRRERGREVVAISFLD